MRTERLDSGAADFDFFTSTETTNSHAEIEGPKELERAVAFDEVATGFAMETSARIACGKIGHAVERIEEVEMTKPPQAGLEIAGSVIKKNLHAAFAAGLTLLDNPSGNRC